MVLKNMALKFNNNAVSKATLSPKIIVIGAGGAGCNAVNNMITAGIAGVDFIVSNTDAQVLNTSLCDHKIQLGSNITNGLGAGSSPEIGRKAAEESMADIENAIKDANMIFITAGMGGGTGTGAAPVIAKIAKEKDILTVGVVTKPFEFERDRRMKTAQAGIEELDKYCDTLIVIPNQNLFRVSNEKTTFTEAFKIADNVLVSGVRCITDLITNAGLVNLDFADVSAIMASMGRAVMGEGEATGEDRAIRAAESAITNPLLEYSSIKGATGILINITGGPDLTLFEINDVIDRITKEIDSNANMKFGSVIRQDLEGIMRVSVVATGIHSNAIRVENEKKVVQNRAVQVNKISQPEVKRPQSESNYFGDDYNFIAQPRREQGVQSEQSYSRNSESNSSDYRSQQAPQRFEETSNHYAENNTNSESNDDRIEAASQLFFIPKEAAHFPKKQEPKYQESEPSDSDVIESKTGSIFKLFGNKKNKFTS